MRAVLLLLLAAVVVPEQPTPEPTIPTVYLQTGVSEENLAPVLAAMKDVKEINFVISSVGGSVLDGLYFIQNVEKLKREGLRVHCIGDIVVASMAANIFESDVCDDRAVTDRTVIIFHGVQAPPSEIVRALDRAIAVFVAPRIGMTLDAYLEKMSQGDWIMNAAQAMQAGVADRLITPR